MNSNPRYVTGAQAGLSQNDQLKIALELILSQGGIAVTQQIYDAVEERLEERLGQEVSLSDQGRHSLRRIINKVAVDLGYIHPYDGQNPGWRITEEGAKFIQRELGHPIGRIKSTARAYVNFLLAVKEIRALLDFHRKARCSSRQRDPSWEAFKKAGIILIITSWETFMEDILELYINQQLREASSPNVIRTAFNTVAGEWYVAIKAERRNRPKAEDFIRWTGESWKQLVRDRLQQDLAKLNTPNSRNIKVLSERYLGTDITDSWSWPGTSAQQAREKLDELIELRGELAHRIGDYFEATTSVRIKDLVNAIDLIERLVMRTEKTLDILQQQQRTVDLGS